MPLVMRFIRHFRIWIGEQRDIAQVRARELLIPINGTALAELVKIRGCQVFADQDIGVDDLPAGGDAPGNGKKIGNHFRGIQPGLADRFERTSQRMVFYP